MKNKIYFLKREQTFDINIKEVFAFFEKPENLALITPKNLNFKIISPEPIKMKKGALIDYTIQVLGIKLHWKTEIKDYNPPYSFIDEQIKGPYAKWIHTHTFMDQGDKTLMIDEVEYCIPFSIFGEIAHVLYVKNELKNIFNYRAQVISNYLKKVN